MTTLAFLNGVSALASLMAGMLFFRFWRETADRLFAWFAVAFWMFAVNWTMLGLLAAPDESRFYAYIPRLAGFTLIIMAIVEKNRRV